MISILVAYTKKNRVIGSGGVIPWNLPSERDRFKEICKDKFIIMGRKSFDEIGHGLPYCTIVIISRTLKIVPRGCVLAKSLEDGMKLCEGEEILVAGGGEIYKEVLPFASRIYATEIEKEFSGDVFFPLINDDEWTKTVENEKSELGINYKYITYNRK